MITSVKKVMPAKTNSTSVNGSAKARNNRRNTPSVFCLVRIFAP
ncbi:MAG: hypothetical protein ACK5JF_01380 [Oscillospiraceae bacterium]